MKTFIKLLAALGLAIAISAIPTHEAEARKGRGAAFAAGVAAGIIGLGIIGAAEADARARYGGGHCYKGRRVCDVVERDCFYNRAGDLICPAPERRCYRPTICD
jgi:hypothetical protein